MNIKNFIIPAIACFCCSSFFISCEEKGLMVNDNDVSYIIFAKDMTKDTTTVSFKVYNEGEVPEIPLEVSVYGKVQDKDLKKILRATDGLGTEATRAGIIELLFKRGFLTKKGRYIHSTDAGKALFHSLPEMATRPDMTAHWESVLTQISEKQCRYQDFMQPLVGTLYQLIDQARSTPVRQFRGIVASGGGAVKKAPNKRVKKAAKPKTDNTDSAN